MKKVFYILTILVMGLVLVSCGGNEPEVDGAIAKLETAKTSLNAVISDPNNITEGFSVPTTLIGGVSATWESDEPGVVSFAAPASGVSVATVNRPALGDGDATVVITATLSIPSELEGADDLSDTYSLTLTVKENTVADLVVESVADVLAITDEAYDGTYQVTLANLTVFAKGDDAAFAYDGTGSIEIYGGASADMEVGKVYTVAGTIEWYFGLWEITGSTATEQASATAVFPTQESITDVPAYLTALKADGADTPAKTDISNGSFEPIYAEVTGKVYVIPGDDSNYNTYIVGSTVDTSTLTGTPTDTEGFMVYYHTNDLPYLRLYNGLEVTMDIVIYTYRSNNSAFAIYYVGGPAGIEANVSDAEAIAIDAGALDIPASSAEALTLDLPTTGVNGSTIVWSFTDSEDANNSYVDLATGAATVPEGSQVTVSITATLTLNDETTSVVFEIKLGEYPLSTIADAKALDSDVTVRIQGYVIGYSANKTIAVQDATGALAVFNYDGVEDLEALIGHNVEIIGVTDLHNGLEQIGAPYTVTDLGEADAPEALDLSTVAVWDDESLVDYQATLVSIADLKVTAWSDASYGNIEMTLLDETTGNELSFKWDSRVTAIGDASFLQGLSVGDYVTFTGAVLNWSNGPQLTVSNANQVAAGTAPVLTDANYVVLDAKEISITTSIATAGTLTLPTTGTNGSDIAWSFTDSADTDNSLIDLSTGAVTLPTTEGTVEVGLTATVTKGTETETVEFVVSITYTATIATDLFISEYIEGSSNNKAIEIYNGTGADVDLTAYVINTYSATDGMVPTTAKYTLDLTGTLAAGDVLVIYNSSAGAEIAAVGDVTSTITYYNGDDAVALLKNDVIIDIVGAIDVVDPGSSWPVNTGATAEYTLVRAGSVTGPNATFTEAEWVVYPQDTFDYLGTHMMD